MSLNIQKQKMKEKGSGAVTGCDCVVPEWRKYGADR